MGGKNYTTDKFIEKAKIIQGSDKYDYSLVKYINWYSKIEIVCKKHGVFLQSPHLHLQGEGCSSCFSSKGENKIEIFLINNNIKYVKRKIFKDCIYKKELPFDFYLPEYNICIEYDGEQHFKEISVFGGKERYQKQILYDEIKNNYCQNNLIQLIRIPYYNFNKIETILAEKITFFPSQSNTYR